MKYDDKIFIEKSNKKHNNKYDYSLINYKGSRTKIKIICPEHGVFEQQSGSHKRGHGCPACVESNGESEISNILNNLNIKYIKEYKLYDNELAPIYPLKADFYLPSYNMIIEYNGIQHYKSIDYFGGEDGLKYNKERDKKKKIICKKKGYKLLLIKYTESVSNKLMSIIC